MPGQAGQAEHQTGADQFIGLFHELSLHSRSNCRDRHTRWNVTTCECSQQVRYNDTDAFIEIRQQDQIRAESFPDRLSCATVQIVEGAFAIKPLVAIAGVRVLPILVSPAICDECDIGQEFENPSTAAKGSISQQFDQKRNRRKSGRIDRAHLMTQRIVQIADRPDPVGGIG
ncbi:hypothetical protein [Planctellipticum variicoloris]|uniref:hypothetical protein n=1 Tax=Planctellipticum variicoloris TaxID=3064265 RepID=UPI0030138844|nr:hypothetical protein SH412_004944 [Planctomycetaceae bacterium SH412]